jgi:diamine N-acetyltransferase
MSAQQTTPLVHLIPDSTMEDVRIIKVTPSDIDQLQQISVKTFTDTFAEYNSEENMAYYLDQGFSKEKLAAEIADTNSAFYFAQLNTELIGYLKVNEAAAQTELKDHHALEIERIYVTKEYQGKKIGQLLYNWALKLAEEKKAHYIWLGVWEHNLKAIRFYEKNGFVAFSSHVFRLGSDEQTDIMMRKELR